MNHRFVVRRIRHEPADGGAGAGSTGTGAARRGGSPGRSDACMALYARALALWPGLDRRRLARTHGDPRRIARLVARRTVLPEESILSLLEG